MSGLREQRDQNREGEALRGGSLRGFPHPPQTWPGSRCYWKGGKSTKKESPPPFPPPAPPHLNIRICQSCFTLFVNMVYVPT